jgi:DNA-binding transcriptional regulator YiaG
MNSPTPDQIRSLRAKHHLTQTQAAALIYRPQRTWQDWERGVATMDPAYWELVNIKLKGLQ